MTRPAPGSARGQRGLHLPVSAREAGRHLRGDRPAPPGEGHHHELVLHRQCRSPPSPPGWRDTPPSSPTAPRTTWGSCSRPSSTSPRTPSTRHHQSAHTVAALLTAPLQVALLLFMGQKGTMRQGSDYLAVSYIKGHVLLTWDLGAGPRRIFTPVPVDERWGRACADVHRI